MMHAKKFVFINKFWTYFIIAVSFILLLISIAVVSGAIPKSYAEENNDDEIWTIKWDQTQRVDEVKLGQSIEVPIFAAQPIPGKQFLYKWEWADDAPPIVVNTYETITPSDIWPNPGLYTFCPLFEDISYNVILNATDGTFNDGNWQKPVQIKYGEQFESIANDIPVCWGHKFLGFFKDNTYGSKRYINPDGTPDSSWDQEILNSTIYAHWSNSQIEVTLDANGGSFTGPGTFKVSVLDNVEPLSADQIPTKENSTFLGYFDQPEGGKLYFDSEGKFSAPTWTSDYGNDDITLYAQWNKSVVKIDLRSEGVTTINTPIIYEKYGVGWFSNESCESEKEISKIEVPERAGHDFKGYYYNNEMLIDNEGNIVGNPTIFDLDTTLYALWEGDIFEVIIPREGPGLAIYEKYGDGWYDNAQCTGQKITAIDTVPSDTCNDFDGYYFNNVKIIDSDGKISEDSCSLTLNAKLKDLWVPKVFTVNLNPGEGVSETCTKVIYEKYGVGWFKDKECTETFDYNKIIIPQKDNLSFLGYWYSDGQKDNRIISAEGNIVCPNTFFPVSVNYINEDIIVFAKWEDLSIFEICLDAGEDAISPGTQFVYMKKDEGWFADPECNQPIVKLLNTPTKYGYIFAGYCLNENEIIDSGGSFIEGTSELFSKNETLNAEWVPNRSWITFNKNGGTGGLDQLSVLYGAELQYLRLMDLPTKPGFYFEGYFDEDGVIYINSDGTPARLWDKDAVDVDLFAHWSNIVKVTLNAGQGVDVEKKGTTVIYEKYDDGWYRDELCTQKITIIDIPTKEDEGAYFEGYFDENKKVISSDGMVVAEPNIFTNDVELYAVWDGDIIKVTLGFETGTIDIWEKYGTGWFDNEQCEGKRLEQIPNLPTKDNYILNNFYYRSIKIVDSEGYIKVDSKTFTSPTRLDASWSPKIYTIKLDAGSGASDVGTECIYEKYGEGWYSTPDCRGAKIKNIDNPKGELKFLGYWDWHNNNIIINASGWIDALPTYFTESTTLYASWDIAPGVFKVSLHAGDGVSDQGTTAIYTKNEGTWYSDSDCKTKIEKITIPKKNGYVFEGYFYGIVQYISKDGYIVYKDLKLTENADLYASWKSSISNVTLDKQGGKGGLDSFIASYDKPTPNLKSEELPKKDGYSFEGYFDSAIGGDKYIDKDGSSYKLWDKLAENVTLYAHWNPCICKIKLNAGDDVERSGTSCIFEKYGVGWFSEESCTEQSKIVQITCPEKKGSEFCGYYLSNTPIIDSEGRIVADNRTFTENTELYALWTGKVIGITLKLDSGSISIWEKYEVGWFRDIFCKEEIKQINIPTKDGYDFEGFYYNDEEIINKNGLITAANNKFVAPASLTPNWTPKIIKISLESGPDCSKTGTEFIYEKFGVGWFSNSSCTDAEKISKIDCPEKPNNKFLGYKNQNTSYVTFSTGQIVCANDYFKQDTTINAIWGEISIYEVELNAGKDVTEVGTQVIYNKNGQGWFSDHECIDPISKIVCPNKTGYTFTGYYHDSNEIISKDGTITGEASSISSSLSLNASWDANKYTIKLNHNEGVGGISEINATYGLKMLDIKPEDLPTRNGYYFDGYYDNAEDGILYINKNGITIRPWDKTDSEPELFAHWSLNQYRIDLNFNGGTGVVDFVNATYSEPMPTLSLSELPVKEGFGFLGYFDDVEDGTQYYWHDGTSAHNWDKLSNATLYAHWIKIENTVGLWGKAFANNGSPLSDVLVVYQNDYENKMFTYRTDTQGQYKFDYLPKGQDAQLSFYKEGYVSLNKDLSSEYMATNHYDCNVEIDEATKLSISGLEYHKTFYCVYFEAGIEKYHEETIQFDKLISVGTKITCSIDGVITIFNEDYDTKSVIRSVPVDGYRFELFTINGIPLYAGHEFTVDKVMDLTGSVSYVPITPAPTPTPEDINADISGENIVATWDTVSLMSLILMFLIATTSLIAVRKYLY